MRNRRGESQPIMLWQLSQCSHTSCYVTSYVVVKSPTAFIFVTVFVYKSSLFSL